MIPPELPDGSDLRAAPELAILALLDAALTIAAETLRSEHPGLDAASQRRSVEYAPHVLVAYLLLQRFREIRGLLANYRSAVCRGSDGLPF
jgi:hypothetical protein